MRFLAVDPGHTQSAYVEFVEGRPVAKGIISNQDMVSLLDDSRQVREEWRPQKLYIEMIASYGMPVGAEVFDTCVWIGRFIEVWQGPFEKVYRKDVKLGLCGDSRAKDSNIRQVLLDRFGPGKDKAIGKKACPGPLYGVSKDVWAALAVAVYVQQRETRRAGNG